MKTTLTLILFLALTAPALAQRGNSNGGGGEGMEDPRTNQCFVVSEAEEVTETDEGNILVQLTAYCPGGFIPIDHGCGVTRGRFSGAILDGNLPAAAILGTGPGWECRWNASCGPTDFTLCTPTILEVSALCCPEP